VQLTRRQIAQFRRDGFLFFPGLFSEDEASLLRRNALRFSRAEEPHKFYEPNGSAVVRTALAPHNRSRVFAKLARHPRLVEPARRLIGADVYLHQLKINYKAAFDGEAWDWHQDFGTWYLQDGMPKPRAVAAALFLDEVTSMNGPLMIIPGSHKAGRLPAEQKKRSYPLWTLRAATVERLAKARGICAPTGPAGSVIFFHCNMAHASGANMTPWRRVITYVVLNDLANRIRRYKRPDWIALRDFSPLVALADDCLRPEAPGR
jgi:ectoine hydroxylase